MSIHYFSSPTFPHSPKWLQATISRNQNSIIVFCPSFLFSWTTMEPANTEPNPPANGATTRSQIRLLMARRPIRQNQKGSRRIKPRIASNSLMTTASTVVRPFLELVAWMTSTTFSSQVISTEIRPFASSKMVRSSSMSIDFGNFW